MTPVAIVQRMRNTKEASDRAVQFLSQYYKAYVADRAYRIAYNNIILQVRGYRRLAVGISRHL